MKSYAATIHGHSASGGGDANYRVYFQREVDAEIKRKDELLSEAEYLLTEMFREDEQARLSDKIRKELNNEAN